RTVGMSDAALAEMIPGHEIDVLIDLSLHSAGNRILVFARRAAPVQISYLGYPGTTGLTAIDARLTDAHLDPPGNERFYVERSVRLESYWCYQPPAEAPEMAELAQGAVTFGCLNNFSKINEAVLETWGQILSAVPGSRLILHAGEGSHRQWALQHLGVEAARVEFVGKRPL